MDFLYVPGQGIDLYGRTVSGNEQIAQRCANRIDVPRGSLLGDPSIGVCTDAYLGAKGSSLEEYRADIEAEISREPGAENAIVVVTGEGRVEVRLPLASISMPIPGVSRFPGEPTITSVIPAAGPILGGQIVTITGTSFNEVSAVTFGGQRVPILTKESETTIRVVTPPNVVGACDLVVKANGKTVTLVSGYTYESGGGPIPIGGLP